MRAVAAEDDDRGNATPAHQFDGIEGVVHRLADVHVDEFDVGPADMRFGAMRDDARCTDAAIPVMSGIISTRSMPVAPSAPSTR